MEEEYRAYGYEMPGARVRLEQLGETVEILRRAWQDERASFAGRHYRMTDAPLRPKPRHLPILLGGASDRLLELAALHADGWNCPNPAWRELGALREKLLLRCESIGRDPATLEISEQVLVVLGRTDADVRRQRENAVAALGSFARFDGDVHVGRAEEVAAALAARQALGVDRLMVMFGDFGSPEQIELFADEVLPRIAPDT
jgi:alkanesulfonate monooxygenase SsuD/methylene tetrahydromethanopterin reductase-like flavin-dependent oxidoreductase (luciferase family)